jgi:hypothetical protein
MTSIMQQIISVFMQNYGRYLILQLISISKLRNTGIILQYKLLSKIFWTVVRKLNKTGKCNPYQNTQFPHVFFENFYF